MGVKAVTPKDRASQSICPYGSQRNTICSTLDIRLVSIATIALLVLVGCATSGEHADSAAGGDDSVDPAVLNDTLGPEEQAAASCQQSSESGDDDGGGPTHRRCRAIENVL